MSSSIRQNQNVEWAHRSRSLQTAGTKHQSSQSTPDPNASAQEVGRQGKPHSTSKTTGKSYHHQRKTKEQAHLNSINLDVKEYINLPKPSDNEAWKALDDQLYEELPTEIGEMSPSEQLNNLESHLYKRLWTNLGWSQHHQARPAEKISLSDNRRSWDTWRKN